MVRRLLAALLCRPNECVAVEDLLLALWGDNAPGAARKTLQVYVRRLRSALGEPRILHEPAGYRIIIQPGELDSAEFAQLVMAAQNTDPQQASTLLADAINLWRSNAYEDVRDHAPIADEARRLDEERIRVQAWHARLQLDLGRHAELIPHLTKLIEAHPYREDLRGHLMLALYRSGRQTDALEVFRNTRRLLDEELGVEPGPDLQRLHESILRADPSLALPKRPSTTVPRGLPADIRSFVGRHKHLHTLDEMLGDPSPIVISAISGSAGVGKTALAVHWAHAVADRFPDGQLYINLRGFDPAGPPVDPADAIRHLLDALGVAPQRIPASPEAQGTLYRSLLSDRRVLVVLDNARDAQQIRPLLPGTPGCLTLITSRNQQTSLVATHGARPLMLDVLTESEAHDFLTARLGHHRIAAEPSAAADIIARCARLPLALAIAAAQCTTRPSLSLAALAAELGEKHAFTSDDPLTDLHGVFSWSYDQLTQPAARLFRLLGLHPGPDISAAAAASLAGLPPVQTIASLSELVEVHLLTEHASGRYTFHDLLRAYAAELNHSHREGDDGQIAVRRLLDHYVHTARAASGLLNPTRTPVGVAKPHPGVHPEDLLTPEDAMVWFVSEHNVLLAAVRLAAATGFDRQVCQLAGTLAVYLDWQGHWHDLARVQGAAIQAAVRLDDPHGQATAHRMVARAHHCLGDNDLAHGHLIAALQLFQQIGDPSGQANTHMGLGMVCSAKGDYAESLRHNEQAFELFEVAGSPAASARALNAMGYVSAHLGRHETAIEYCSKALPRTQELHDRFGEACTWDSIGFAYHHLAEHEEAIACYIKSLKLFKDLGDRLNEATILDHLGETFLAQGDRRSAGESWQQAIEILLELHHPNMGKLREKLKALG
nr:BTAD domain-containing putative transcriptional regulator [Allorhizocola rhizosphaerae]